MLRSYKAFWNVYVRQVHISNVECTSCDFMKRCGMLRTRLSQFPYQPYGMNVLDATFHDVFGFHQFSVDCVMYTTQSYSTVRLKYTGTVYHPPSWLVKHEIPKLLMPCNVKCRMKNICFISELYGY